ncbi:MAG: FAD-dependent thymidylate synthase [Firmicutes bacterium]|nr:FAD-dependent thymidylate synthase [Bacillota bacterium]
MAEIYAIAQVPPEISAYGMARYSRSHASLRESLLALSQEKAERFLNTFYFAYGHASIADLAHIALAIENISLLAAMDVVNEPLWDGQERSTRYQTFAQHAYYTPSEAGSDYHHQIAALYSLYQELAQVANQALTERFPPPPSMKDEAYQRTIRARALDVARYALPLATLTSLGQITNARVLERQIARLLTSPWPEVQDIGRGMKRAVTEAKPFNLAAAQAVQQGAPAMVDDDAPVAPTLIKHADADGYRLRLSRRVAAIVAEFFPGETLASPTVEIWPLRDAVEDLVAGIVYEHAHLSYGEILQRLRSLGPRLQQEILDEILALRGAHDPWPDVMRQRPLIVDTVIDVGAFRDINRHRRLDKIVQPLEPRMGFAVPPEMLEMGVGQRFEQVLDAHYRSLAQQPPLVQGYLLPLAHRRRALLRMDWPEAAYLIELRSRSSGHFSYRRWANDLYRALAATWPTLVRHIRVTPFEAFDPFER